jgi:bifunctional DNA-binding transcriptional regulator/antitoxin component of YhaV-PrlF toxin-antitoxin module
MKLLQLSASVDKEGRLILPMDSVNLDGYRPGDQVNAILTMSENGEVPFPMLKITPGDSVLFSFAQDFSEDEEAEDEENLSVPYELLEASGIPIDSDLDVACYPGTIVIRESDILDRLPEGLKTLFQSFGIRPDTVREVMEKEGYFA